MIGEAAGTGKGARTYTISGVAIKEIVNGTVKLKKREGILLGNAVKLIEIRQIFSGPGD